LQAMLDREGFDTDVAMTLQEAKALLAKGSYVAMTLDLVLPDGHAVPFMRDLRLNPETAQLPLIVISAHLDDARKELDGLACRIVDWLEKPIPPDRLARALRRVTEERSGKCSRILHVEDDQDIREVVRSLLKDTAQ